MKDSLIIETENLRKNFVTKTKRQKKIVEAVRGIDLAVKEGEIYGLLGPNGAGKSTTQKMLSTLLLPTSGKALINGYDLENGKQNIRQCIGFVSQAGGTDSLSTGMENLILQAQLYGIDISTAKKRATEFIDRFQMASFAGRIASSYSGGQRRRLDLALGMIHHPRILLLDEPTVGLDPQSRAYLWEEIKALKIEDITVILTTHYLDEADKLCDTVAIIDNGEIVARGTPNELKDEIGADSVNFGFVSIQIAQKAKDVLTEEYLSANIKIKDNCVRMYIKEIERVLPNILRLLDSNKLTVESIDLSKPTLDDVFLKHTGRSLREDNL